MEKKNDGGSAFPFNRDSSYEQLTPEEEGMSLRDYFAGNEKLNIEDSGMVYPEGYQVWLKLSLEDKLIWLSKLRYMVSDAMIIQRDK